MLRSTVQSNPQNWDEMLPFVLVAYRATIHESTKCSPNLLFFSAENRLPLDMIYADGLTREVTIQCPCGISHADHHISPSVNNEYHDESHNTSTECFHECTAFNDAYE